LQLLRDFCIPLGAIVIASIFQFHFNVHFEQNDMQLANHYLFLTYYLDWNKMTKEELKSNFL
jgi:hypothetical protein